MIKATFLSQIPSLGIAIGILLLMLLFFKIGFWVRRNNKKKNTEFDEKSFGAAEGSLLGLLALFLAFTFNMSSSRYDNRLQIVIEEANDIGTAVLRADLYPDSIRSAFRHDFKAYVSSRIEFFEAGADTARIYRSLKVSAALQQSLWNRAAKLGQDKENMHRTTQMIPALNSMIDIVSTRNAITLAKVPELIIYLLFVLCLGSAFLLGYTVEKKPDWIIIVGFSLMVSVTIYLIIDLDRPRRGLITIKGVNEQIVNLRSMFSEGE